MRSSSRTNAGQSVQTTDATVMNMKQFVKLTFRCTCNLPKPVKTTLTEWLKMHEGHGQIFQRPDRGMRSVGLYVLECPCMARLITNEESDFPVGTSTYLPML